MYYIQYVLFIQIYNKLYYLNIKVHVCALLFNTKDVDKKNQ